MGDLAQSAIDASVPGRKNRKQRKRKNAAKRAAKAKEEQDAETLGTLLPDEEELRRAKRRELARKPNRGRAGTILSRSNY